MTHNHIIKVPNSGQTGTGNSGKTSHLGKIRPSLPVTTIPGGGIPGGLGGMGEIKEGQEETHTHTNMNDQIMNDQDRRTEDFNAWNVGKIYRNVNGQDGFRYVCV